MEFLLPLVTKVLIIQDDQAKWTNYISLIELPCGMLTNLLLSSYCDKIGHKLPLVLAISGNMLSSMYLALLATKQFLAWPMASVLAYGVLNRILGGFSLVSCARACFLCKFSLVMYRLRNSARLSVDPLHGTTSMSADEQFNLSINT